MRSGKETPHDPTGNIPYARRVVTVRVVSSLVLGGPLYMQTAVDRVEPIMG
jgi:hypothetical protein